jgi:hypothetical protein
VLKILTATLRNSFVTKVVKPKQNVELVTIWRNENAFKERENAILFLSQNAYLIYMPGWENDKRTF